MKRMKMGVAMLVAGTVAAAGSAYAGRRYTTQVVVSSTSFQGSFGDARASADGNQWISCYIRQWPGTTVDWVSCTAVDAAGNYASCWNTSGTTASNRFISTLRTVNSDAYIQVDLETTEYFCKAISVWNDSGLTPKR